MAGGVIAPGQAPVLLATITVILATLAQVGLLALRRQRIEPMLWISLGLVVLFGGATVWFNNDTFIKWKPTVLYWLMAGALAVGQWVMGRNVLKLLLGAQLKLPERVWARLSVAWTLFFAGLGVVNLWVAYHFSTDVWVSFKAFGALGLMIAFMVAQGVYLSRHVVEDEPAATGPGRP
ncbi:septation protein A [Aquabacterium sp. J223]|uniref:septation protein A n=1 Tax=Aquabacterium sp. J223 TaxID=2898431 RepID=UPI00289DF818|nr:septation protein A [Aquabacterium sp. J223]